MDNPALELHQSNPEIYLAQSCPDFALRLCSSRPCPSLSLFSRELTFFTPHSGSRLSPLANRLFALLSVEFLTPKPARLVTMTRGRSIFTTGNSTSVFGVSPESMQCGYDSRGNSVPKILLLMQERLYAQGGLKAEGIFRIAPENGQEELVREQLNKGIVPEDIDVHCLASLIKAWFRELPRGVLDGISPEQVLQCNTEEECVELMATLPPTQAALLGWAVELMADVVEEEEFNKMNPRNVAMVFAPNMSQMSDPLTALMHAVQVMNLLKTLILKTLRDRDEEEMYTYSPSSSCTMISDQEIDNNSFNNSEEGYKSCTKDNTEMEPTYSGEIDDCDSLREIEECFLKRLEWKEETTRLSFSDNNFDRSVITDCEARLEEKCAIEEVCKPQVDGDPLPCA